MTLSSSQLSALHQETECTAKANGVYWINKRSALRSLREYILGKETMCAF